MKKSKSFPISAEKNVINDRKIENRKSDKKNKRRIWRG